MRTIDIYIKNKELLLETYNKNLVSNDLIEYILSKTIGLKRNEEISLKIYVTSETKGCTSLIKKGIEMAYYKNIKKHKIINLRQFTLLLLGLCILFISTLIKNNEIIREVVLIGGWVPIWESIELELLTDTSELKRRKRLKKLLNCKIEEFLE